MIALPVGFARFSGWAAAVGEVLGVYDAACVMESHAQAARCRCTVTECAVAGGIMAVRTA